MGLATGEIGPIEQLLEWCARQEPWRKDALCREHRDLNWFPARGEQVDRQRAVCGRCAVASECLDFALSDEMTTNRHGIWGGLSARERRQLKRNQRAA
jgi:WhiB family redox-sensing transcriptional regulator